MKRMGLWWIGAFCSLVLGVAFLTLSYQNARVLQTSADVQQIRTVIVDAGHGGMDGGTVASDGTPEKQINLAIAQKLRDLLECAGYTVVMTRTDDRSIHDPQIKSVRQQKISDIRNRMQIMEQTENSVFVSIHQNHFTRSEYFGTQVFYSGNDARSRDLAECIQQAVVSGLQPENTRAVKQSGTEIYLLYHAVRPAVLVECGFLSNPQETEKLKTDDYQTKMALSILQGIRQFIRSTEEV